MPLEVRPGAVVPIPCRSCGKFLPLTICQGSHKLKCLLCFVVTTALVDTQAGTTLIRTQAVLPSVGVLFGVRQKAYKPLAL